MNNALAIIGVPAIVMAAAYAGVLWGRWAAAPVAIVLSLALGIVAMVDRRRRRATREAPIER
ncbi:MAG TPA: hypothetical protein VGS20_15005 [Candidatus Acidoferrales bacterium]|nr:hypothetical protein [Candidatus Acidoferrales bacterium]